MPDIREILADEDVIELIDSNGNCLDISAVFKTKEIIEQIGSLLYEQWKTEGQSFAREGLSCQVLQPKHPEGWRKGKVRLAVEFIPDPPIQEVVENQIESSPLTEISESFPLDQFRLDLISRHNKEAVNVE